MVSFDSPTPTVVARPGHLEQLFLPIMLLLRVRRGSAMAKAGRQSLDLETSNINNGTKNGIIVA